MEATQNRSAQLAAAVSWGFLGILLAIGTWRIAVPWDLSEVDAQGNPTGNGADQNWIGIAAVMVIVIVVGVGAGVLHRRIQATALTVGGASTWALLFAWRSAAGRAAGANLWMVPFVFIVVPATVGVVGFVNYLAKTRQPFSS